MKGEVEPQESDPSVADAPVADPSPELAGAPRQRAYVPMSMAAFPTALLDKAKKKKKGGGGKPAPGAPNVASPAAPEPASDDATTEDAPIAGPVESGVPAVGSAPKPSSPANYAMIAAAVGLLLVVLGSLTGIVAIAVAAVAWWALGG